MSLNPAEMLWAGASSFQYPSRGGSARPCWRSAAAPFPGHSHLETMRLAGVNCGLGFLGFFSPLNS